MSLLNILQGSMASQSSVQSLSGKTGLSEKQVSAILAAALPLALKYMTSNASTPKGAAAFAGALTQHKGNGKTSTAKQIEKADVKDGAKIVNHIFGKDKNDVIKQLSKQTSLSPDQVGAVLAQMAPALMSNVSDAASQSKKKGDNKKADNKKGDSKKASGIDLSDGFDMKDVMGILGSTFPK